MEVREEKEITNRPTHSLLIGAIIIFSIISTSLLCHFVILKQVSSLKLEQELWQGKKTDLAKIITDEEAKLAEIRRMISGHAPQLNANEEELQKLIGVINARKNELNEVELQRNDKEQLLQKALAERDSAEEEKKKTLEVIGRQKALLESNGEIIIEISKNREDLKSSKLILEELTNKLSKIKAEISFSSEEIDRLEDKSVHMKSQITELNKTKEGLIKEYGPLKSDVLKQKSTLSETKTEVLSIFNDKQRLQNNIANLMDDITKLELDKQKHGNLKQEIEQLQKTKAELNNQLQLQSSLKELSKIILEQRKEQAGLSERKLAIKNELLMLESQKNSLNVSKSDLQELKDAILVAESRMEIVTSSLTEKLKELAKAKERLRLIQEQIKETSKTDGDRAKESNDESGSDGKDSNK